MIPNFEVFGKTLSAYVVLAAVGFLVTVFVMYKGAKKVGLDEFHVLFMILFSGIGIVLGGHLLYGITNIKQLISMIENFDQIKSFDQFLDQISYIFGGGVFYGGMVGAIIVGLIYIKIKKLDKDQYLNFVIIGVPLFNIFGRIGCFCSGCCFGVEWEHGFTYDCSMIEIANGVPRFPVQLVESLLNVVLVCAMWYIYTKTKHKFKTFDFYLLTYGVCRFLLEYLRGDEYRGIWMSLSTSQWISIVIVIYAVIMLCVGFAKDKKQVNA